MSAKTIGTAAGFAAAIPTAGLSILVGNQIGQNVDDAKSVRKGTEKLEEQRREELRKEAAAREAARVKAETTGQRVGASTRSSFVSAIGFGSGNTQPGLGTGTLFGG